MIYIAIIAIDGRDLKESTLFERDCDADLWIRSWLGEYVGTGKCKLSLKYGLDEITENSASGDTDQPMPDHFRFITIRQSRPFDRIKTF